MTTTRHVVLIEGNQSMELTLREPLTLGEIWRLLVAGSCRPTGCCSLTLGIARIEYRAGCYKP